MALIRTLTVSTTAFERMKEKFYGFRQTELVKLASKSISEPLSQLVNETIVNEGFFPDAEKIACITPAFKKEDRLD